MGSACAKGIAHVKSTESMVLEIITRPYTFDCCQNFLYVKIIIVSIQEILKEIGHWMDVEGVEAIGQGVMNNKDCIMVFISGENEEISKAIPSEYKGYPVVIEISGIISAEGKI